MFICLLAFTPHCDDLNHDEGVGHNSEEKVKLDELHKHKIAMADEVFVVNVGGYVGDSTKSEVQHAWKLGKVVRWLEPNKAWLGEPEDLDLRYSRGMIAATTGLMEHKLNQSRAEGKMLWWDTTLLPDEKLQTLFDKAVSDKDWISVMNYAGMKFMREDWSEEW